MKSDANSDFFVIERKPDAGVPKFFEKIWSPDLPLFHFPSGKINKNEFIARYSVKAKTYKMTGDYFKSDYIASDRFVEMCENFGVDFISAIADVTLYKDKRPERIYYFFMPIERVDLLDEENSVFSISKDLETGKLQTRESGLDSTYYDKIDLFVAKKDVGRDLFLCTELKETVCSARFRKSFEDAGMSGIGFKPIDQNFRYDPWANFGSF